MAVTPSVIIASYRQAGSQLPTGRQKHVQPGRQGTAQPAGLVGTAERIRSVDQLALETHVFLRGVL